MPLQSDIELEYCKFRDEFDKLCADDVFLTAHLNRIRKTHNRGEAVIHLMKLLLEMRDGLISMVQRLEKEYGEVDRTNPQSSRIETPKEDERND